MSVMSINNEMYFDTINIRNNENVSSNWENRIVTYNQSLNDCFLDRFFIPIVNSPILRGPREFGLTLLRYVQDLAPGPLNSYTNFMNKYGTAICFSLSTFFVISSLFLHIMRMQYS